MQTPLLQQSGGRAACPASTSGRPLLPPCCCPNGSSLGRGARASAASRDSQGFRFKHVFQPADSGDRTSWTGWPLDQQDAPSTFQHQQQPDERVSPEQLWSAQGAEGSVALRNPHAQRFRVRPAGSPAPLGLPGPEEQWHVEMLHNYSTAWPSLRWDEDGLPSVRLGFLAPVDDPKWVPFFFYKGLESVRFTWGERAFQAAYAAAYLGVHAALFCALFNAHAPLAVALACNWALGRLSPGRWVLLLLLACAGRLWLYYTFQVARLLDAALARLFPGLRRFFWANFALWVIYLVLSPSHYPPVPLAPFMPGTEGPFGAVF